MLIVGSEEARVGIHLGEVRVGGEMNCGRPSAFWFFCNCSARKRNLQVRDYLAGAMLNTLLDYRYHLFPLGGDPPWGAGPSVPYNTMTNNQEVGVDAIDVVQTDGRHIYMAHPSEFKIIKAWPTQDSELIATVEVGERAEGLLLEGNRALVF
ncbi:MAG: hypothetical protein GY842_11645, partial [bacterium]|nr:hypothetical protein [bacterium]